MSDNVEETAYYLRTTAMYMDLGTEAVLTVFNYCISGTDISAFLTSPETKYKLNELYKANVLNRTEYNLVSSSSPNPEKFDIALLVRLVISLFSDALLKPTLGWKIKPQPHDYSLGADLLRIRDIRNKLIAHRPKARLSKEEFDRIWNKVEALLLRITGFVDPDSCLSVASKLKDYKEALLDPLEATVKKYLDQFTAWNQDISELQKEVDTLRKKAKEFHLYFKKPPERYVRYIKLLFEGGYLVLSGILKRELYRTKLDLTIYLRENRESLLTAVDNAELRGQLFPSDCSSDPTKWDLLLLVTVIISLFGDNLTKEETENIQLISQARANYAAIALSSLDIDRYISVWTDLTSKLTELSQNLDGETARQVKALIEKYKKKRQDEDTAESYIDSLRLNGVCVKTLEDIYKENMGQLDRLLGEMAKKGIKLKNDHVFELKIETKCENEDTKKEAEDTLGSVFQASFADSDTEPKHEFLRQHTNKLFRNINKIQDVQVTGVTRKCIMLEVRCSSFSGSHDLIRFILSPKFQDCLQSITNELSYRCNETVAVCGNVTLESIKEVLNDPYRVEHEESVSGISIPITCSTADGMKQVLAVLSDEDTTNSFNQMADQLSLHVNKTVTVKAFPVLNEFSSVFGETDSENSGSGNHSNDEEAVDRFSSMERQSEEIDHADNNYKSKATYGMTHAGETDNADNTNQSKETYLVRGKMSKDSGYDNVCNPNEAGRMKSNMAKETDNVVKADKPKDIDMHRSEKSKEIDNVTQSKETDQVNIGQYEKKDQANTETDEVGNKHRENISQTTKKLHQRRFDSGQSYWHEATGNRSKTNTTALSDNREGSFERNYET